MTEINHTRCCNEHETPESSQTKEEDVGIESELEDNDRIENSLKNSVQICPKLQELISKYENEDFYVSEIPVKYAYDLGLYLLNKKLVRYGLDNHPKLEHLRTFNGREDGNYHDLNKWLGAEYANPRDIRYVVLLEKCVKEQETFLWYLQYTDNEQEIKKLEKYLNTVSENQSLEDDDYYGDISYYTIDIVNTVSQQTAKEMTKIRISNYMDPQMLSGKFKGLVSLSGVLDYEKPSAKDLDHVFYILLKKKLFTK